MSRNAIYSSPRNTYEIPRLWVVDAKLLLPMLVCVLHFRWYTVGPTLAVAALLWYFEVRRSMTVSSSMRMVRSWLAGSKRPPRSPSRRMLMVDYQRRGVYWRPYRERDWM